MLAALPDPRPRKYFRKLVTTMSVITFQRDDETRVTTNFARNDFQCPCGCGAQFLEPELAERLQTVRDKIGKPIKITSGYRCLSHNRKVGGSSSSRHLYGVAADWRLKDRSVNPVALGILAREAGFNGVGIYWHSKGAFVHTDVRSGKATWLCTTPGKYPSTTYNSFILPTIKRGSSGTVNKSATILLQKLLKVTADGIFGVNTETALKYAQQQYGLAVDGICGPKSWKAISGAAKYL